MRIARIAVMMALLAGPAQAVDDDVLTRGQQVSNAIAAVTSTAISPLLGVSLLGIYDYARSTPGARASLPFYSQPYFWIPMCVLLALIFSKDLMPHFLKKPLDAIEVLIVNKAALVLLVFPVMFHEAHATSPHGAQSVVALAAGTMITLVVWMVGHAADVLALLSPVPFLDLIVKGSRAAVMLVVAGSALVNPTLGLIVSGIVIAICAVLFGFAMRAMILGWAFAWDVLFSRKQGPEDGSVQAFTMGKNPGMPRQTLGVLTRDAHGALEFRYRRMGFGPSRRVQLEHASGYDVGRGLVYPSIVAEERVKLRLLPRYRGSEEAIRDAFGMAGVKDLGLGKLVSRAADYH